MGISGLIPFLKKASRPASIKEFKGGTAAIDSYCWLHKGAFSCAEKLAQGQKTDQYVYYCMKYVNNLLLHGVKPVMVFDGCRLPSKREVEKQRRERRELFRKKAAQLLRDGKRGEARDALTKCIDITPQMALDLMNACRAKGVDCIVAPYEADAQLAYLNKVGIADVIITEDSDLVLFGCQKVMFKMDFSGNGILVDKSELHQCMDLRPDVYTFDKFRHMAILSGCDYLASLPGIGLGKANKLFKLTRQTDMELVLKKLPTTLKMSSMAEVPPEYIQGFFQADNTFLFQLVFDPMQRKLMPLNPYPPEIDPKELTYAGPPISRTKALQIALGNIDINTGEQLDDFNPDTYRPLSQSWDQKQPTQGYELSIWDPSYRPRSTPLKGQTDNIQHESTAGKERTVSTPWQKKSSPVKRARVAVMGENEDSLTDTDLMNSYSKLESSFTPPAKKAKLESCENFIQLDTETEKKDILSFKDLYGSQSVDDTEIETENQKPELNDREQDPPHENHQLCHTPSSAAVKKEKSPRNAFAVKGSGKKARFNLDQRKPKGDVKSRFFKAEKPLPKTSFFHKMAADEPKKEPEDEISAGELPDEEADMDQDRTNSDNDEQIISSTLNTSSDSMLNSHTTSASPSSSQGSFRFKSLGQFKSSFGKPNLPRTSAATKQFKPVKIEDSLKAAMKKQKCETVEHIETTIEIKEDSLPALPSLPGNASLRDNASPVPGNSLDTLHPASVDEAQPSLLECSNDAESEIKNGPSEPSFSQMSQIGSIDNESFDLSQSCSNLSQSLSQSVGSSLHQQDPSSSERSSAAVVLLSPQHSTASLSAFKKVSKSPKTANKFNKSKSSSSILSMFKSSNVNDAFYKGSKMRKSMGSSQSPMQSDLNSSSEMTEEAHDLKVIPDVDSIQCSKDETPKTKPNTSQQQRKADVRPKPGSCRRTGLSKTRTDKDSQSAITKFFGTPGPTKSQYF